MSKTALLKAIAVDIAYAERQLRSDGHLSSYHRGARNASISAFVIAAQDGSRSYAWIGTRVVEEAVEATTDERLEGVMAQWSDDLGYAKVLRSALDKGLRDYWSEVLAKADAERVERERERAAVKAAAVEADPFFGIA